LFIYCQWTLAVRRKFYTYITHDSKFETLDTSQRSPRELNVFFWRDEIAGEIYSAIYILEKALYLMHIFPHDQGFLRRHYLWGMFMWSKGC
jgi:hypothetical protein